MKRARYLVIAGLWVVTGATVGVSRAHAQTGVADCASMPNPVFMAGTTAVIPVIRLLGARLKTIGVTLLWNENSEGCGAVAAMITPPTGATRPVFSHYTEDPPGSGKVYSTTCNGKLNQVPDLAINDVSYAACSQNSLLVVKLPNGYAEFQGPVQGLVPVVPISNVFLNDITALELSLLYGCGAQANFMGFSADATIYDYNAIFSGMRELWARSIGMRAGANLSIKIGLGSYNTLTAETMVTQQVGPSLTPQSTIGYTSTEFYDQYRNLVKALKVQGVGQERAYLPDSDGASTDKINIREGRYMIQNALWLVAAIDSKKVPVLPQVKNLIDWFQQNPSSAVPLPFDVNEIYAMRGVVPQCAMKVTKDGDAPLFRRYKHPQPCHCAFQVLATGRTSIAGCVPCAGVDAGTCPAGTTCSHGYCEAM
jgi:hypothetical protein